MTDAQIIAALDDRSALALTAEGEARRIPREPYSHSPVEELIAVMVVARNRRLHFSRWRAENDSYKAICLAPGQFDCWPVLGATTQSMNQVAVMAMAERLLSGLQPIDPNVAECLCLADGVIAGTILDRTGGANSYWAPAGMLPPGRVPDWAVLAVKAGAVRDIGDQCFVTL
jgi:hypothetical protein